MDADKPRRKRRATEYRPVESVAEVAAGLHLSDATVEILRSHIANKEPLVARSIKKQKDDLQSIARQAADLARSIDGLPEGLVLFDAALFEADPLWRTRERAGVLSTIDMALQALRSVAAAASKVEATLPRENRSRPRSHAISLVACIAFAVKADGIQASDSEESRFIRICRAVFAEAGIHAGPEGPVKAFNERWRAAYVARGFCL